MKLSEVIEDKDQPGTYAGVRFDNGTVKALEDYVKANNIPNANGDWHTTLLYSRKHLPHYHPRNYGEIKMVGVPTGFEIWPSKDKKNVLVLAYSCPSLYQRHHYLMNLHGATYDFDEYKPHVTFSYDAGDLDPEKLPEFKHQLKIVGEYQEDLDAD